MSRVLGACAMRYFVWALRLLVFVAVLMFALKNTDPVAVKFYADYVIQDVPLIVVMLATFVLGTLFGLLLTVPAAMRRRREAMRLRRELQRLQAAADGKQPVVAPEAIAPMSPLYSAVLFTFLRPEQSSRRGFRALVADFRTRAVCTGLAGGTI